LRLPWQLLVQDIKAKPVGRITHRVRGLRINDKKGADKLLLKLITFNAVNDKLRQREI
jgi:hypothetical protein